MEKNPGKPKRAVKPRKKGSRSSRSSRGASVENAEISNISVNTSGTMAVQKRAIYQKYSIGIIQPEQERKLFTRKTWSSKFNQIKSEPIQFLQENLKNLHLDYESTNLVNYFNFVAKCSKIVESDSATITQLQILESSLFNLLMQILLEEKGFRLLNQQLIFKLLESFKLESLVRKTLGRISEYHKYKNFEGIIQQSQLSSENLEYLGKLMNYFKLGVFAGSYSIASNSFDMFYLSRNIQSMDARDSEKILKNFQRVFDIISHLDKMDVLFTMILKSTGSEKLNAFLNKNYHECVPAPHSSFILLSFFVISELETIIVQLTKENHDIAAAYARIESMLKEIQSATSHAFSFIKAELEQNFQDHINGSKALQVFWMFVLEPVICLIARLCMRYPLREEYRDILEKTLQYYLREIFSLPSTFLAHYICSQSHDFITYLVKIAHGFHIKPFKHDQNGVLPVLEVFSSQKFSAKLELLHQIDKLELLMTPIQSDTVEMICKKAWFLNSLYPHFISIRVSPKIIDQILKRYQKCFELFKKNSSSDPEVISSLRENNGILHLGLCLDMGPQLLLNLVSEKSLDQMRPLLDFMGSAFRTPTDETDHRALNSYRYFDAVFKQKEKSDNYTLKDHLVFITSRDFMSTSWSCLLYSLGWCLTAQLFTFKNSRQYLTKLMEYLRDQLATDDWMLDNSELKTLYEMTRFFAIIGLPNLIRLDLADELFKLMEICILLLEGLINKPDLAASSQFYDVLFWWYYPLRKSLNSNGSYTLMIDIPYSCSSCCIPIFQKSQSREELPGPITFCTLCNQIIIGSSLTFDFSDQEETIKQGLSEFGRKVNQLTKTTQHIIKKQKCVDAMKRRNFINIWNSITTLENFN